MVASTPPFISTSQLSLVVRVVLQLFDLLSFEGLFPSSFPVSGASRQGSLLLKTGSAVTSIGQLSPSWSCPKYRALKQIRWRQISCVSCSEGLATSKWVQHGLFSGVHFPVANSAKERRDRCFEVGKTFLFCASVRHHVSNCLILLLRVYSYSVTPVDKWS